MAVGPPHITGEIPETGRREGGGGNAMSSEDIPTILRDGRMGIHDIGTHNRARLIIAQGMRFRRAVCVKSASTVMFYEGYRYISYGRIL